MARRNREIYQELANQLVALREDFDWRRKNPGHRKHPLPDQQHLGDTCYDIVDKTSQLDHEAVLEAYFTAYCEKMGMWVVAYERFNSFLIDTIENKPAELKGFFKDNLRLELRKFWRTTVRNLIRLLALAKIKGVVIGSLGNRHGYVIQFLPQRSRFSV
uniref:Uncharacterized protein n=1 Tax=Oryza glumipatula TaxID=40148 RepID=A0A0E0BIH2_9ORYZ